MTETPDILDRLRHSRPLARGPYCRLIDDSITEIGALRTAGNDLEAQLIKLHRNHHGPSCETCQALSNWWTVTGR